MGYKVKLNVFEGPFDLLVYLIENARMSIYDIQITEITRQYLDYVEELKRMDVPAAAEFMVLAASLIEIKSKMLLPRLHPEERSAEEEDPRSDLVEKLLEYKRFKALADMLRQREEQAMDVMEKPQEDMSDYTGQPDEYLCLDLRQFTAAFELFLRKKKKTEEIRRHHIRTEKQRRSAESKMADIQNFFRRNRREASFRELVKEDGGNYEVALTFSSVLEMMKEKRLEAEQRCLYGDITVRATERLMDGAAREGAEHDERTHKIRP